MHATGTHTERFPVSIFTNTSGATGLVQLEQMGFVAPLETFSVAARVSTELHTAAGRAEIPVITEDADVDWINEGAEITDSTPGFETITVIPSKVAGLTAVSNEMVASSTNGAAQMALESLYRQIASKLDGAYFGKLAAPAPQGLGYLTTANELTTDLANLDVFEQARLVAAAKAESLTSFVCSPDDMLTLSTLKESTTSNRALVQPVAHVAATDATAEGISLSVAGVPVYASPAVPQGTIWGIPKRVSILVKDGEPSLEMSKDAAFTRDSTVVRATQRVGFGFPRPAALQKITVTAAE